MTKRSAEDEQSTKKMTKRLRRMTPEQHEQMAYRKRVEACMGTKDIKEVFAVFHEMKDKKKDIPAYIYQMVFNLCGQVDGPVSLLDDAFAVLNHMKEQLGPKSKKHPVDEPSYSALVRLCARQHDTIKAEKLLEELEQAQVLSKLRTYSPLLIEYASTNCLDDAWRIYEKIKAKELDVTEIEYAALLQVASAVKNHDMFYKILAIFMEDILEPQESTWEILKLWFMSEGFTCKEGTVNEDGICSVTGAKLLSIELSKEKEDILLKKVEGLVCTSDERTEQWNEFKSWIDENGPYDVLLDAANIGYFNQNYEGGGFNYKQIQRVLQAYQRRGKKVLIVLHKRRTSDKEVPEHLRSMVAGWRDKNEMYNCRPGNNDDWYWLYAAVNFSGRTLVVSNDEMRDHHFQMISGVDFHRWKERHLVRYDKKNGNFVFDEPRVYSKRSQHVNDSWHFPTPDKDKWLVAHK
ncbi:hypothetical protein THRCLA_09375 [Thraustotheca clavata]|uniref:Mitochondrial ribonuclease P catalytic subunit n=1 Tax=Thraustotheca clavata TaxID=74557 RepID=A0A1V9YXD0_9STRA|nr:hypothetical protein THRCLA_09375 [Thraustotheca clavata]